MYKLEPEIFINTTICDLPKKKILFFTIIYTFKVQMMTILNLFNTCKYFKHGQ